MTTAAEALNSGTGAPAGAAGNGGGSAPNGGGDGLPSAPVTGWWDSVKDADTKAWAANKNYPSAEHALIAHRNLESLMGADKAGRTVLLPKDDNDAEGWKALSSKLGVPANPDGYKLPIPEGQADDGFARTAAGWFHAAGVPPRAANQIAQAWNAWVAEQVKAGVEADDAEDAKGMTALEQEWGANFAERRELAQRGYAEFAKQFGLDDKAAFKRAVSVLGSANLTKLFHGLGSLTGEGSFKGLNTGGGFGVNAREARSQIDQITADRAAGKINDYSWRTEYEPRLQKLAEALAAAQ